MVCPQGGRWKRFKERIRMLDTLPVRDQHCSLLAWLCCPCYYADFTLFPLLTAKGVPCPCPSVLVNWDTPLHRGSQILGIWENPHNQ